MIAADAIIWEVNRQGRMEAIGVRKASPPASATCASCVYRQALPPLGDDEWTDFERHGGSVDEENDWYCVWEDRILSDGEYCCKHWKERI